MNKAFLNFSRMKNISLAAFMLFSTILSEKANACLSEQKIKPQISQLQGGLTAGLYFGAATALSSEGTVGLIGGPGVNPLLPLLGGTVIGEAWIRANRTNIPLVPIPASVIGDNYGWSVALAGDGKTAAVGAPNKTVGAINPGGVYVFTSIDTLWVNPVQKTVGAVLPVLADDDAFGFSVVLNFNGSILFVGAPGIDNGVNTEVGAVHVFNRNNSGNYDWKKRIQAVVPVSLDYFGASISTSYDGLRLLVGASSARILATTTGGGKAYVYDAVSPTWSSSIETILNQGPSAINQLPSADVATQAFGSAVALSGDNLTAFVGDFGQVLPGLDAASAPATAGAVYAFRNNSGIWNIVQKIRPDIWAQQLNFGFSVASSKDGKKAVIGAPGADVSIINGAISLISGDIAIGAAFIFSDSGDKYIPFNQLKQLEYGEALVLNANNPSSDFGVGVSISCDGKVILIGDSASDDQGVIQTTPIPSDPGLQVGTAIAYMNCDLDQIIQNLTNSFGWCNTKVMI